MTVAAEAPSFTAQTQASGSPIMNAWSKVRGRFADSERAERRRQRKIRSAMIGKTVGRGEGGYQSDNATRGTQGGAS